MTINNKALISQLIEFGLSEKEAAVYLALLELEIAVVSDIAKAANINRSSSYVVLESLKKKGLVSVLENNKVVQYSPTNPEVFLYEAENKTKSAQKIKEQISNIVPELKALHKDTKHRPKVRIYEGREGLIAAFEETLYAKEKIMRVCSAPGNLENLIPPNYLIQYVLRRTSLRIKMHGIHPDDKIHRGYIENNPINIDTYILIPKDKYNFPVDFAIWDNKIGFMSGQNGGIALMIESDIISEFMKSIFNLAWDQAKIIGKEAKGYKPKI